VTTEFRGGARSESSNTTGGRAACRGAATILIVDDRETNRDFLVTLLGYRGHRLVQARDGREALAVARAERPDLIISDVLMPTMDGYELVREIRGDPTIAETRVIFTTAHYTDREARALAESCGVAFILPKPADPETVLRVVDAALATAPTSAAAPTERFERDHLRLVTDKLGEKTAELQAANTKLTALIEVAQQLALERNPRRLFHEFTRAAREIIGARYALVCRSDPRMSPELELFASGFDLAAALPRVAESLDSPLTRSRTYRWCARGTDPLPNLPHGHPPVQSLLAASIVSLTTGYGWVCVSDKIGFETFSEDDERILGILGAQLGRIYENGRLYLDLTARTTELEAEVAAHRKSEAELSERARLAVLGADIGVTLTRGGPLAVVLHHCAAALVWHLDAAFARIWTLNADGTVLQLQASAGMYTHLDGAHSRVRVGALKIGTIAASRQPHLTNDVLNDPLVSDREWARREGMVAFAGYPLIVEGQLVGVMAMFAREALGPFVLEALGSVAHEIARRFARPFDRAPAAARHPHDDLHSPAVRRRGSRGPYRRLPRACSGARRGPAADRRGPGHARVACAGERPVDRASGSRQPHQVGLRRHHVARAAHAAQHHHRVQRSLAQRRVRPAHR